MASATSDLISLRSGYPDSDAVYVSRNEFERLVQISPQYASLRENLIRGGVTDETLDLLSNVVAANQGQSSNIPAEPPQPTYEKQVTQPSHPSRNKHYTRRPVMPQSYTTPERTKTDEQYEHEYTSTDSSAFLGCGRENEAEIVDNYRCEESRRFVREADRTLLFSNLPDGTTHADITALVRGGMLLDVFMRYKDHSATVSFLYEEDAHGFYEHVRRNDLYINHKRVLVSWHERQFRLTDHIGRKIKLGATRNLVIRRCKPEHTEEAIRDDLEHIHNLVVVKIDFIGNNCFVSTNSVAYAGYARTCMMSRLKYKGSHIEFDLDECAQPFIRPVQKKAPSAPFAKTSASVRNSMANRFHLLDMDD